MRDRPGLLPICLEGVTYSRGGAVILAGLDLAITAGGPSVVMGPNGSGKTTLLKVAMGLVAPTSGRVRTGAGELARAAFVFQRPVMLRRSAAGNLSFALRAAGRAPGAAAVEGLLDLVGLAGLGERPARRLSGGEQQRLAIARALARAPEVLFLDEPTASLDPAATKAVEDLIGRIAAQGVKIVMATHDLGQARRLASEIVFLVSGRIAEHAPAARFLTAPSTAEGQAFVRGELVI